MSDEKPNVNVNAPVQGVNVVISSTQSVGGDITITMGDMTQTIQQGVGSADDKETLQKLVDELKVALQNVPVEIKDDAEEVVSQTQKLVAKVSEANPSAEQVKNRVNLLKTAAENIKDAMPTVLVIASGIIAHVLKMAGN